MLKKQHFRYGSTQYKFNTVFIKQPRQWTIGNSSGERASDPDQRCKSQFNLYILATEIIWMIYIPEAVKKCCVCEEESVLIFGEHLQCSEQEKERRRAVRTPAEGGTGICPLTRGSPHLQTSSPPLPPSSFLITLLSNHKFTSLGFEPLSYVIRFFLHQTLATPPSALMNTYYTTSSFLDLLILLLLPEIFRSEKTILCLILFNIRTPYKTQASSYVN